MGDIEKREITLESLSDEWDLARNQQISIYAWPKKRKAWWICKLNHSWQQPLVNRLRGYGCLFCSNKRVLEGFNDLQTKLPELAAEWHPVMNGDLTPKDVVTGSKKTVWWRCGKGHDWQAQIARRSAGSGCLICANKLVVPGVNDLATTNPQLAAEWDHENNPGLSPNTIAEGSARKVNWVCGEGHRFQSSPNNRSRSKLGMSVCPVCGREYLVSGVNDLETLFPALAKEWNTEKNGKDASMVLPGSASKAWWKCGLGHEWEVQIFNRTNTGTGCPYCKKTKILPGFNDLATTHPELVSEWDFSKNSVSPSEITSGSQLKISWMCGSGHSWVTTPAARTGRKTSCPYCTGQQTLPGFNDLATTHPEIAAQIDPGLNSGISGVDVTAGSAKVLNWRCELGHVTRKSVVFRVKTARCSVCSNYQVLKGFNDLASVCPHLVKEVDWAKNPGFDPESVTAFSYKSIWWLCPVNHSYKAAIRNRAQNGSGCGYCSGQKVLVGFNDLETKLPDIAKRWHYEKNNGLLPSNVTPFSGKRVWWLCEQGHEWTSVVANISAGTGCPGCAAKGFDQSKPGLVYVIEHAGFLAKKIGITNVGIKTQRLKAFQESGWTRIAEFVFEDGRHALKLETEMLRWIRGDLGLPPYLSKQDMRSTSGWSETFSSEALSTQALIQKVQEQIQILGLGDQD